MRKALPLLLLLAGCAKPTPPSNASSTYSAPQPSFTVPGWYALRIEDGYRTTISNSFETVEACQAASPTGVDDYPRYTCGWLSTPEEFCDPGECPVSD